MNNPMTDEDHERKCAADEYASFAATYKQVKPLTLGKISQNMVNQVQYDLGEAKIVLCENSGDWSAFMVEGFRTERVTSGATIGGIWYHSPQAALQAINTHRGCK